ncbi:MAG TPA: cysteine desulfurase-like protein [Terriglobales bacterium]|nr:cysteine desulfurase-like protein [Terriglobales bacterium]
MPDFPIAWVRQSFPALNTGENFLFFDNGAGSQVPQIVLDAVRDHLLNRNVQRGGRYRKSQEVDATIQRARESVATFLNAREAEEVAFGMNATSFIRIVSLALADTLRERKEIVVSDLDHEANVATWLALQRYGVQIRWWRVREDGTLHLADLEPVLNSKTRLLACTIASNALGSIVDVKEVARMAHAAGAEVFLDAVHYAPHGPIDVQELDCDYLVCSGYKIFAPHMGFLWGKRRALEALPTFREDFIPDQIPAKIEVGTFVYENVAGMDAAITYLEELGTRASANGRPFTRRTALVTAMESIRKYEARLSSELLRILRQIDGVTVYGIQESGLIHRRVPTICFNVQGVAPSAVAATLADKGIGVRDGNMYSPRLLERLGIPLQGGAVRASLVHYNTLEEIRRFAEDLRAIARR